MILLRCFDHRICIPSRGGVAVGSVEGTLVAFLPLLANCTVMLLLLLLLRSQPNHLPAVTVTERLPTVTVCRLPFIFESGTLASQHMHKVCMGH